jgi:hypothetical protein
MIKVFVLLIFLTSVALSKDYAVATYYNQYNIIANQANDLYFDKESNVSLHFCVDKIFVRDYNNQKLFNIIDLSDFQLPVLPFYKLFTDFFNAEGTVYLDSSNVLKMHTQFNTYAVDLDTIDFYYNMKPSDTINLPKLIDIIHKDNSISLYDYEPPCLYYRVDYKNKDSVEFVGYNFESDEYKDNIILPEYMMGKTEVITDSLSYIFCGFEGWKYHIIKNVKDFSEDIYNTYFLEYDIQSPGYPDTILVSQQEWETRAIFDSDRTILYGVHQDTLQIGQNDGNMNIHWSKTIYYPVSVLNLRSYLTDDYFITVPRSDIGLTAMMVFEKNADQGNYEYLFNIQTQLTNIYSFVSDIDNNRVIQNNFEGHILSLNFENMEVDTIQTNDDLANIAGVDYSFFVTKPDLYPLTLRSINRIYEDTKTARNYFSAIPPIKTENGFYITVDGTSLIFHNLETNRIETDLLFNRLDDWDTFSGTYYSDHEIVDINIFNIPFRDGINKIRKYDSPSPTSYTDETTKTYYPINRPQSISGKNIFDFDDLTFSCIWIHYHEEDSVDLQEIITIEDPLLTDRIEAISVQYYDSTGNILNSSFYEGAELERYMPLISIQRTSLNEFLPVVYDRENGNVELSDGSIYNLKSLQIVKESEIDWTPSQLISSPFTNTSFVYLGKEGERHTGYIFDKDNRDNRITVETLAPIKKVFTSSDGSFLFEDKWRLRYYYDSKSLNDTGMDLETNDIKNKELEYIMIDDLQSFLIDENIVAYRLFTIDGKLVQDVTDSNLYILQDLGNQRTYAISIY